MDCTPNFWAVIPANVRYDANLRPNAKLLYAEVTALANAKGYCFAQNEYFAKLFGLAGRTISDLIKQLADNSYFRVELLRDPATNEILERRIWVSGTALDVIDPPAKNGNTPPAKNSGTPPAKNGTYNNPNFFNNTPYSPPEGASRRKPKKQAGWKPERFEAFWQFYPRGENKQAAIRAWDRLKAEDDLLGIMGQALSSQKASEQWGKGIGIPYASTWLNGRRWEDEVRTPEPETDGGWIESEVL